MNYRHLGKWGVQVSEVGLGSWLTYGGATESEQATNCIHRAYELGINFFDTANAYARGESEKVVGAALSAFSRESYVLSTKVFFPMGSGPNERGLSRKHIMEQCNASLKRLGTDYIDLYYCHRYGRPHASRRNVDRAARPRDPGQDFICRCFGVDGGPDCPRG